MNFNVSTFWDCGCDGIYKKYSLNLYQKRFPSIFFQKVYSFKLHIDFYNVLHFELFWYLDLLYIGIFDHISVTYWKIFCWHFVISSLLKVYIYICISRSTYSYLYVYVCFNFRFVFPWTFSVLWCQYAIPLKPGNDILPTSILSWKYFCVSV